MCYDIPMNGGGCMIDKTDDKIIFSENLKRYRLKAGLTQTECAAALGFSKQTWQQYESGRTAPNVFLAAKMAAVVNCTVNDLLSSNYLSVDN